MLWLWVFAKLDAGPLEMGSSVLGFSVISLRSTWPRVDAWRIAKLKFCSLGLEAVRLVGCFWAISDPSSRTMRVNHAVVQRYLPPAPRPKQKP